MTPTAEKVVSPEDKELIDQKGICVIDCSWAKFDEISFKGVKAMERKLPLMLASNPVNHGRPYKMNCAEALAASLLLGGYEEEAHSLLQGFSYSEVFFELNDLYFSRYMQFDTSEEIIQAQIELEGEIE